MISSPRIYIRTTREARRCHHRKPTTIEPIDFQARVRGEACDSATLYALGAAFANDTHKNMPKMRHNATNLVIDGEGDTATGSAFLIGYLAAPEYKVIVTGRYIDQLTRTSDGWRFTDRQFTMDQ